MIPLLLAAALPLGSAVPFQEPALIRHELPQSFGEQVQVEQFDPVARAAVLATSLPRQWSGVYQPFTGGGQVSITLNLASLTALGQMVDVRGTLSVGNATIPVQGNLNAKSDQLDLILLGAAAEAGLEQGGEFRGLQGFTLSGWRAPRFTHPGGQLTLTAVGGSAGKGAAGISGLW